MLGRLIASDGKSKPTVASGMPYYSVLERNLMSATSPHRNDLVLLADLARMLGIHRSTLTKWIDDGRIRSYRLPTRRGDRRVAMSDAIQFLRDHPVLAARLAKQSPARRRILCVSDSELLPTHPSVEITHIPADMAMRIIWLVHHDAVVIDHSVLSRSQAIAIATLLRGLRDCRIVHVANEDAADITELAATGCVVRRPVEPTVILRECLQEQEESKWDC